MKQLDENGLELCKFQARIFEESTKRMGCSTLVFLRRFFKSDFAKKMDEGESSFFTLDANEAFEEIEKQFGPSEYGKVKYSSEVLYWVGYMTRYISYTRGCSSYFVYKAFPPMLLINSYSGFHTQNEEWVIEQLLEAKGLKNEYFDPNFRLKEILRNRIHI